MRRRQRGAIELTKEKALANVPGFLLADIKLTELRAFLIGMSGCWHLADNPVAPAMVCRLLTRSGHQEISFDPIL
jgi:hypothetical protein